MKTQVRHSELRNCVKVEVDVLGSPYVIVLIVSVDVQQQRRSRLDIQSSGTV